MAYMNKEKKAKIVEAVKAVLPKGWKATFAIRHYSTIVCTIRSAPFDLVSKMDHKSVKEGYPDGFTYLGINHYHAHTYSSDKEFTATLEKIINALNTDNYDRSDIMTDYFNVGHYIDLQFGSWAKPFKNSAA